MSLVLPFLYSVFFDFLPSFFCHFFSEMIVVPVLPNTSGIPPPGRVICPVILKPFLAFLSASVVKNFLLVFPPPS